MHLSVSVVHDQLVAKVSRAPLDSLHHPSVDILFESAARALGSHVIGLVLTGMGSDGLVGSRAIIQAGGRVLAESAESCVVYGMPRSVIEHGLATAQSPLAELPALLLETLRRPAH
jgi:two-component system chemotaxis response regulator CheB